MKLSLRQRANLMLGGLAAGSLILFNFSPTERGFYPVCPFHALSGLQCPGCGGTRALFEVVHLHWGEAARLNSLGCLTAAGAFARAPVWLLPVLRGCVG